MIITKSVSYETARSLNEYGEVLEMPLTQSIVDIILKAEEEDEYLLNFMDECVCYFGIKYPRIIFHIKEYNLEFVSYSKHEETKVFTLQEIRTLKEKKIRPYEHLVDKLIDELRELMLKAVEEREKNKIKIISYNGAWKVSLNGKEYNFTYMKGPQKGLAIEEFEERKDKYQIGDYLVSAKKKRSEECEEGYVYELYLEKIA